MNWKLITKIYLFLDYLEKENKIDASEEELCVLAQCLYEKLVFTTAYKNFKQVEIHDALDYALKNTFPKHTSKDVPTIEAWDEFFDWSSE